LSSEKKANVSIGAIGEPFYDKKSDRVKYFSEKEYFHSSELVRDIDLARKMQEKTMATRMTMRAIVTADCYSSIKNDNAFPADLEAKIPLHTLDGHVLLYLANNNANRKGDSESIKAEESAVREIVGRKQNDEKNTENISKLFFTERIINPVSKEDAEQIADLYNNVFDKYMCDFTPDSIRKLVDDNYVFAARHYDGSLVSIAVGEVSVLNVAGRKLQVTELSDMATLSEYRGMGLNKQCAEKILENVKNFDLIYAEARACFFGSNNITLPKILLNGVYHCW